MTHYVCTGTCKGVAKTPGTCQAENCPKHNVPLTECSCQDEGHKEILSKEPSEE